MSIFDAPARSHRRRLVRTMIFTLLVAVIAVGVWRQRRVNLPPGVARVDYAVARARYESLYHRKPDHYDVLSLAGEVAVSERNFETAAACFRAIPTSSVKYGASARLQQAQVELKMDHAAAAEQQFREFLAVTESDRGHEAHRRTAMLWLAYLYSVQFRLEERRDVLAAIHRDGFVDVFNSKQFYFPHLLILNSPEGRNRLREFLDQDPKNVLLQTAWGRYLIADGRLQEANDWLERLVDKHPDALAVVAAWLELCFEQANWDEFEDAAARLPKHESTEPWLLTFLRGQFAMHAAKWERAVEMFSALLAQDPAHPGATAGLARAYRELGRDDEGDLALQRSLVLAEIRVSLPRVTESDPEAAEELAGLCRRAGLSDAADTFDRHAMRIRQLRSGSEPQSLSLTRESP